MESSRRKKALVTGITGQDGSYLAELLLAKGYEVYGVVRRTSSFSTSRIDHLDHGHGSHGPDARLRLLYGDLTDGAALRMIVDEAQPDEVYNLAAQSHVKVSFDLPEYTSDVTGMGAVRLIEAVRQSIPEARFYQASSSEMFGRAQQRPQNEATLFHPRSPYASAKAFAFYTVRQYREAYDMFATNGILFNHESPRRGEMFVTRKITLAAARIKQGLQEKLYLGNLNARRDWGFAGDYVDAIWRMLQADQAGDYVIATGRQRSVREFCNAAFEHVGLPLEWRGENESEQGVSADGQVRVEIDPHYFRPSEVDNLEGDATKAREELGWRPTVDFEGLVQMMVDADLKVAKAQTASD